MIRCCARCAGPIDREPMMWEDGEPYHGSCWRGLDSLSEGIQMLYWDTDGEVFSKEAA